MNDSTYRVAVIPGDGIGPEVIEAALLVLQAGDVAFSFQRYEAGDACLKTRGVALPPGTLAGARGAQAVLFGAVGRTAAEVILRLRRELHTFVNLRPSKAFEGVDCLYPHADIVIVRENTECLYAGIEAEIVPGVVTATRVISREASTRIARFAFEYALQNGRSKVTAIHKSNVLRQSDGLWLRCCREVAESFPNIAYEEQLVDSAATLLVTQPDRFDLLLTPNLFGDILSDLVAGLIGGLGLCPSANLGADHALFEPVHGTAPDIAGQGKANPTAAILCAAMLLRHFEQTEQAKRVERALERAIAARQSTADLGGTLSTMAMAQAVVDGMDG